MAPNVPTLRSFARGSSATSWGFVLEAIAGKEFPRRLTTPADERKLARIRRKPPDSMTRRRARARLERMMNEHVADVRKWIEEPITPARASQILTDILVRFGVASVIGHVCAGITEDWGTDLETATLASIANAEVQYLTKFASEVNREDRIAMYAGAVGYAFAVGFSAAAPADARIRWVLGIAEHCEGCLELAAGGPYGKVGSGFNPLPTVPAAGDTPCLARCKCHLEVDTPVPLGIEPTMGVEVTKIGRTPVDPTSPAAIAAATIYQNSVELLFWAQRLAYLDDENSEKWKALYDSTKASIEALAKATGHEIRLSMTDAEVLEAPTRAKAAGYRFIRPEDLDDDLLLLVVIVLWGDEVHRGKIKRMTRRPPTVTLDSGRTFRLDERGRAILFAET